VRGGVGPQEPEAGTGGKELVDVGVADVVVGRCGEARSHIGEAMLQDREVDGDGQSRPQGLLVSDGPVRAAPDDVAELLGLSHQGYGDDAGRLAHLQRPVDVKADERDRGEPGRVRVPRGHRTFRHSHSPEVRRARPGGLDAM